MLDLPGAPPGSLWKVRFGQHCDPRPAQGEKARIARLKEIGFEDRSDLHQRRVDEADVLPGR